MFLAKGEYGMTAWHMASEKSQIEKLHKLWDWAKEELTQEELKNMILDKDYFQRTAWHMVAKKGRIEVLHKLRE